MTHEILYELKTSSDKILIRINLYKDFVSCEEDIPGLFKHGTSLLDTKINQDDYEKIVIHSLIDKNDRGKIYVESPQHILDEVCINFIKEKWEGLKLIEIEQYKCNHFEQQVKYIITSINIK